MRASDSVRDRLASHCSKWPPSLDAKLRLSHQDPRTRRPHLGDISTSSSPPRATASFRKVSASLHETSYASRRRNMALAPAQSTIFILLLLSGQWTQVFGQESNDFRLCDEENKFDADCVLPGPFPMSWHEAHRYCRQRYGFLLGDREHQYLEHVPSADLNNETDVYNYAWTAVTRYGGKLQWIEEYPVQDINWMYWLQKGLAVGWNSGCYATKKVEKDLQRGMLLPCSKKLEFYCKISRSRTSLKGINFDDMELHMESNVEAKDGWVEVDEIDFPKLQLTCTAYHKSTGEPFNPQPPVFWSKDDMYFNFGKDKIIPAEEYEVGNEMEELIPEGTSKAQFIQGTFGCEAWLPRSPVRLVSNKILISHKDWIVLILNPCTLQLLDDLIDYFEGLNGIISHLQSSFRDHLPNIDDYIFEPIYAKSDDFTEDRTEVQVNYTFLVHVPSSDVQNGSVYNLVNKGTYIDVYAKNGYLNSSSASLALFCLEHTELIGRRYGIKWPFTKVGRVSPEYSRFDIPDDPLEPGYCHWNYTHGAWLDFDASKYQCFDFCPKGYTGIADNFCTFIMEPNTWDKGFRNVYKTGFETDVLTTGIHQQIYSDIKALASKRSLKRIWLPIKRKIKRGPLLRINPYESGIFTEPPESNISWAQGHPESDKECVALDMVDDLLLTLDCKKNSLPFISVTDISHLQSLPNNNWTLSLPKLITESSECGDGWKTTRFWGPDNNDVLCFQLFLDTGNYTWKNARNFCKNISSQLPTPGKEYLDWVYKQYLTDNNVNDVWMTYQISPEDECYNRGKLNRMAETNYELEQSTFSTKGWLFENNNTLKTNVLCQKKIPQTKLPRIEFQSPTEQIHTDMCIDVNFDIAELDHGNHIQCFINDIYSKPVDRSNENCQLAIETRQGYYQCHTWVGLPLIFTESPLLLKRDPQLLTFAVSLVEENVKYLPKKHDSTFTNFPSREGYPTNCTAEFIRIVKEGLQNFSFPKMTVDANNFYFSPDLNNNDVLHNFHLELRMKDELNSITEEQLFESFGKIFEFTKHISNCTFSRITSTFGCIRDITADCSNSSKNLIWPKTKGQANVLPANVLRLTEGKEPVSRKCKGNFLEGYHWGSITKNCLRELDKTTQKLWNITQSDMDGNVLETLASATKQGSSLTPVDIYLTAKVLHNLSVSDAVTDLALENIVDVMDNIMEASNKSFEKVQEKFGSSRIMIEAFENIAFKVNISDDSDENVFIGKAVSVARLNLNSDSKINGFQIGADYEQSGTLYEGDGPNKLVGKVAIKFPGEFSCADSENPSEGQSEGKDNAELSLALLNDPSIFQNNESLPNHSTINKNIILAACSGTKIRNLNEPIQLFFRSSGQNDDSQCVYWDFEKNSGRGNWSTDGCERGNHTENYLACNCYHLTSFAVLVKLHGESNGLHSFVLSTITILGCTLSMVGLMLVFTTYSFFKLWRGPQKNKILVNLSISIFCSQLIFLAGINQTWNVILCRSVAVTLHYFILASFAWMLVEGIQQYLLFVKVTDTYIPRFMMKACACAWGLPLLPVLAVLVYDKRLYDNDYGDISKTNDKVCWMSTTALIYAFLPPLVVTMAINSIIFIVIIFHNFVKPSPRLPSTLSESKRRKMQIKMAVCTVILLGFSWIFGLLAVGGRGRIVFSYLFCIFNSLQGFFLFFFFVYKEKKAGKLWGVFLSILSYDQLSNNSSQNLTQSNSNENARLAKRGGYDNFSQTPSTHTTTEENMELTSTTSVHS